MNFATQPSLAWMNSHLRQAVASMRWSPTEKQGLGVRSLLAWWAWDIFAASMALHALRTSCVILSISFIGLWFCWCIPIHHLSLGGMQWIVYVWSQLVSSMLSKISRWRVCHGHLWSPVGSHSHSTTCRRRYLQTVQHLWWLYRLRAGCWHLGDQS